MPLRRTLEPIDVLLFEVHVDAAVKGAGLAEGRVFGENTYVIPKVTCVFTVWIALSNLSNRRSVAGELYIPQYRVGVLARSYARNQFLDVSGRGPEVGVSIYRGREVMEFTQSRFKELILAIEGANFICGERNLKPELVELRSQISYLSQQPIILRFNFRDVVLSYAGVCDIRSNEGIEFLNFEFCNLRVPEPPGHHTLEDRQDGCPRPCNYLGESASGRLVSGTQIGQYLMRACGLDRNLLSDSLPSAGAIEQLDGSTGICRERAFQKTQSRPAGMHRW